MGRLSQQEEDHEGGTGQTAISFLQAIKTNDIVDKKEEWRK